MGYACPFVLIATCRHDRWSYQAVSLHWCSPDCGWVSLQLLSATSSAGCNHKLCTSHSSASSLQNLFTLPLLTVIVPQQEQLHALTMATIRSTHLEMKVHKCQEFSSDFRQTLWLHTDSFMDKCHTLFMFLLEVSAGFNRRWAHLCLTNVIVLHAQSYRVCFEDFPWPQLWSMAVHVCVCVSLFVCLKCS